MRVRAGIMVAACALAFPAAAMPASASLADAHPARAVTSAPAPASPTVQAGINDPRDSEIAVLQFMPAEVRVTAGTPVTWTWEGAIEPHSVTFVPKGTAPPNEATLGDYLAPREATGPYDGTTVANSGLRPLLPGTPTGDFTMSFARPGRFTYYCAIHPNMIGTVDVVRAPREAQTPAQVRTEGRARQRRWLAEGRAAKESLDAAPTRHRTNPDGTTTWVVEMGRTTTHTDVLAFAPTPAKIEAGDHVEFVNHSKAPHTATFPGHQAPITNPIAPETAAAIPGPSPQELNSVDLFNTGRLPGAAAPAPGEPVPPIEQRRFTFVVPDAGRYDYYCILHVASGMGGKVVAKP
jgi:plastocyanin